MKITPAGKTAGRGEIVKVGLVGQPLFIVWHENGIWQLTERPHEANAICAVKTVVITDGVSFEQPNVEQDHLVRYYNLN